VSCLPLMQQTLRKSNQDRLLADPEAGIYLVADGMGGLPGGDIAAQLVIDHLPELLERHLHGIHDLAGDPTLHAVSSAITELSTTLQHHQPGPQGMGATVVLACVRDSIALIGWLGDSHAYLLHQQHLQRLTTDHCLAQLLVDTGDLTPNQAKDNDGGAGAHPSWRLR
jgi:serine/threonine protein phosphatase PrpC